MRRMMLLRAFESFVNSERCKTKPKSVFEPLSFESFVNSERCKTPIRLPSLSEWFESFVNSERCKTIRSQELPELCLRALLIQKDVKQATM